MKETNNSERAVMIRMKEKLVFEPMMASNTVTPTQLADKINLLFASYGDYIGSTVNVVVPTGSAINVPNTVENNNVARPYVSLSLFFQANAGDSGEATLAFEPIGTNGVDRQVGYVGRMEAYEKRFSNAKKFQLTIEGETGLDEFIINYCRNNWKKTCVSEFEKQDRLNLNQKAIQCKVSNININRCLEEIYGDVVEAEDGTHKVEWRVVVDSIAPKSGEWLLRIDRGDKTKFAKFANETGLNFTSISSELGIVPVVR